MCTSSSEGDARRSREDVAFRNGTRIEGGGSAGDPVNVVRASTSFEDDIQVRFHIERGWGAEDPDGVGDGVRVV